MRGIEKFLLQGCEKELEELLGFEYAPCLVFEDESEIRKLIQKKEILDKALKWGKLFSQVEGTTPKCSVRWLGDDVGYGLFAEEQISQGTCIGEYTGHVRRRNFDDRTNNYLYQYPFEDEEGFSFVIDAHPMGNHTRFINHSSNPNLKPRNGFWKGIYHKILVAEKTINKGEQLFYDYGSAYWYIRSPPLDFKIFSF
jgi:SET domain-containing protein